MSEPYGILIIDDEETVRDSCTHVLGKGNYRIRTAQDGLTGLKITEEFKPDLVFVDLKMPGISGMEVLEAIQKLDPTIVTVVITGYATIDTAVEAMKKGAYDFLPKPFGTDELRLATMRGIEKRRLLLDAIALRREKEIIRENFTSIVSHELKSPLIAVQQTLYAFLGGAAGELSAAQKEMLERIKNRVDLMLKSIHAWVELTSIDFRQLRERFKPLDIPALLTKALEMLQPQAAARKIRLRTHFPSPVAGIDGDEGTLLEVFLNIIGNAVKYSEEGGAVSVAIKDRNQEILISVSDTGVGIEPEDIPFIFDDFYRGKSQSRTGELGSGLGLAISKRIINAHDGTIAVASEQGKGSTFTVTLTRSREPVPAKRI